MRETLEDCAIHQAEQRADGFAEGYRDGKDHLAKRTEARIARLIRELAYREDDPDPDQVAHECIAIVREEAAR